MSNVAFPGLSHAAVTGTIRPYNSTRQTLTDVENDFVDSPTHAETV